MRASSVLGPNGALAGLVEGFAPRDEQRRMAELVEAAIADNATLVCEAGTGVGKTFAYLVPAMLSEGKVIVSTGTKNLQDQLFNKDLPIIREALLAETGRPMRAALLKGRASYLCRHRLDEAPGQAGLDQNMRRDLAVIRDWSLRTRVGDLVEIADLKEDAAIRSKITSTSDNCLGSHCDWYDECFVYQARREAQEADLVVVNHHLLCADLGLREDGFGEILPSANTYIVDEAHQLPEVGSQFFGQSLTSRGLLDLARDCVSEQIREAGDLTAIRDHAAELEKAVFDLRLSFGEENQKAVWRAVAEREDVELALVQLDSALARLSAALELGAERGKGLESCYKRSAQQRECLANIEDLEIEGRIHWLETFKRAFAIHMTPLDIAAEFQARLPEQPCAWVFTSATLAVHGQFDHFFDQLGLIDVDTGLLDSPFDYANNALLYSPPSLPQPNDRQYTRGWLMHLLPVLQANRGRAFLLFTAHRALREAAEWLRQNSDFELFVQGDAPRALLLERFRTASNALLLGASSFWEGVDVRGDALSMVVIDRLPFASPGDPVLAARTDALREQGLEPFTGYQLPKAVIALKQGVGRLIRDSTDRGIMVICDPRLRGKSYGRQFLSSLPPMRVTRDIQDVYGFLDER